MKIYCDEAGYTGNDLLEINQPYFVYCGVRLDDKLSEEIKDYVYKNYKIQGNEIKGKNLVNNVKGRRVIKYIFENYSQHARITFDDKKYALAAKIFEHGVEPYLSSNELVYTSKFNEYIAIGLYVSFISKDVSAEVLFSEFLTILRGKNSIENSTLKKLSTENPVVNWVIDIITHNPSVILGEIGGEGQVEKWVLDLTMTSLLGILTDWSKDGDQLEVICDNSVVFEDNRVYDHFQQMGLANSKAEFLGNMLGFNLKKEIVTSDSKQHVGLQIADLFSSTVYYCLNNQKLEFSKDVLKMVLKNSICTPVDFCVMPKVNQYEEMFQKNIPLYNKMIASIYHQVKNS